MDFDFNQDQRQLREAVLTLCERFDGQYWLEKDRDGGFPEEFYQTFAKAGWLGIAMPEEYGGAGLGITEAALMLQAVAESGGGMSATSSIHLNIFGLNPVVVFGTEDQKKQALTPLIKGESKACFAVTEPDAGLNTTKLTTRAIKRGSDYVVNGRKIWISTAQVADYMLLLARTTPIEEVKKPTDGLSLFYTKLDRKYIEVREIDKMGRKAVDSNELFIDELPVPAADLIGEEGKGFQYILHGMNPERILVSAEAVGIGRAALAQATQYAKERIVFDRPIGMNQGIQHPLARCWAELEAANLLTFRAASLYDSKRACGSEANAAKLLSAEAATHACETAMLTHGGFGYAKEYHVERYFREAMILRIAPVSPQLILCNIAEKVLGLPKSY
ncbi:butyryl-CoA dehydrogenase [Advenella kashmirensis WT001]|uniref:Butyryl-CoA dehydrogenase n=1 Tax=Advenella kashmirensis (strain DSM 17095 / LMG 22695 / WT001) TaxID=1036672 RepID=I3UAY9_ADVKW|nr:acyl-CoA dehydrogenase family protein [Advenella kashmirensis]AFK62177.1 butyryl-CoA dehydrogenase [Advenella kashmirensis WT001]